MLLFSKYLYILVCCFILQNETVFFVDKSSGKKLEGYISYTDSSGMSCYIFPDENLGFSRQSLLKPDNSGYYFHTNQIRIPISRNDLQQNEVKIEAIDSLKAIFLDDEKFKFDGVFGSRSNISSNAPVSGYGFLQKIGDQKELYISAIEVMVVNRSVYYGNKVKSHGSSFQILIGKSNLNDDLIIPEILYEAEIQVNSKKNKWYRINLDNRIDLTDVDFLFTAVKGIGSFFSIGLRKSKKHRDIIGYNYVYPRTNEWRQVENLPLPMIKYELSNKSK